MDNNTPPTPKVGEIWERFDTEDGTWHQYEVVEELLYIHLIRTDIGTVLLQPLKNILYWYPNEYRKVKDAK